MLNKSNALSLGLPMLAPAAVGAWPFYDDDEIAAVCDVLASGRVNQWTGDRASEFQSAFADYCGAPYAIALSNGSVALELALRVHGIGPGDEVIVSARSFVASASCVSVLGATPVFSDVDPISQNMSAATIAPLITAKTRAVIPVHLAGWPCDMPAIMALAEANDLIVIEDTAQAVGARIDGRMAGSFGHAAVFSFCQDKIISTGGEGGMLLLRDHEAWRAAWSYKDHGKRHQKVTGQGSGPLFRYVHDTMGTNLRMTEMQAAIGLVQLGKLEAWLRVRAQNAEIWRAALASVNGVRVPAPPVSIRHAYYKLYALIDPELTKPGVDNGVVVIALGDAGIRAFIGSCPEVYLEEAFADLNVARLPDAQRLGATAIMFEVHPTLDQSTLRNTAQKAAAIIAEHMQA